MGPSLELAQAIRQLALDNGVDVDVYEAPASQLSLPAIVLTPDDPWLAIAEDQTFSTWTERYLAICVTGVGDPISAKDQLRELVILTRDATVALRSWDFDQASRIGPSQDPSGIDVLVSTVRVIHYTED